MAANKAAMSLLLLVVCTSVSFEAVAAAAVSPGSSVDKTGKLHANAMLHVLRMRHTMFIAIDAYAVAASPTTECTIVVVRSRSYHELLRSHPSSPLRNSGCWRWIL